MRASLSKRCSRRDTHQSFKSHPPCLWFPLMPQESHDSTSGQDGPPVLHPLTPSCPGRPGDPHRHVVTPKHLPPGLVPFCQMAPSTQLLRSKIRTPLSPSSRSTHPPLQPSPLPQYRCPSPLPSTIATLSSSLHSKPTSTLIARTTFR